MLRWGIAITVLLGLAGIAACSSTSTITPPSGSDAGDASHPSQGVGYGSSPCGLCVSGACVDAITTCNADPTCATYRACLDACAVTPAGDADPSCEAACTRQLREETGSAGTMAQAGLTTCRTEGAGAACAECGAADGGTSDSGLACVSAPVLTQKCAPSTQPSACNKCQFEKCCESVDKVFNGGPATDFSECWTACPEHDIVCITACEKQFPAGVKGFGEYEACTQVNCQAPGACAIGSKCSLCTYQMCGCELANCKVDPGCWHINSCVGSCTTVACAQACAKDAPPASAALYNTFAVCTAQKCVKLCGG